MIEAIVNARFLLRDRPEFRLRHKNGRVRVYTRQLSPMKMLFKAKQVNNLRTASRRQKCAGGSGLPMAWRCWTRPTRGSLHLAVAEKVGLEAALSMSHGSFNCWSMALWDLTAVSPAWLCCVPIFISWQPFLAASCCEKKKKEPGAHIFSLAAAIQ